MMLRLIQSNVLFLFASLVVFSSAEARVIEKIIAIVNDEIVTKTDIEAYQKKLKSGGLVDDALLRLSDPDEITMSRKALINHLIDEKLIDSEVNRKNMAVTIERVEQEIRTITGRNGISREQLKEALAEKGVTFSEYQDFIKTSLERQALIEREISSKIKISEQDIQNFYLSQKGKGSNGQVHEYTLAHILMLPSNGGDKAAKQRAQQVLKKLKGNSATFEKLAAQHSEDPNFSQGAILGTFKAGEMLPEIESAVRDVPQGELSKVVKTRAGYHVFKVVKKTLVTDPRLAQQKDEIQNILYAKAFKSHFRNWLDSKRQEAFIKINE